MVSLKASVTFLISAKPVSWISSDRKLLIFPHHQDHISGENHLVCATGCIGFKRSEGLHRISMGERWYLGAGGEHFTELWEPVSTRKITPENGMDPFGSRRSRTSA
jgi:hypothetical protein